MSAHHHDPEADAEDRLLHRLLFFSDAVFAIVLTLLALELKAPEGETIAELIRGLASMIGDFIAFAGSFAVVAFWWMGHMSAMRRLARFDRIVAALNLVFLLTVCLMPFSTSLMSHGRFSGFAWEIYCWNLILTSVIMMAMNLAISRDGGRLVGGMARGERAYKVMRAGAPGLAFVVSLVVLKFGGVELATLAPMLIPFEFLALYLFARPKAPSV